jgi:hypothetical protein
MNDVIEFVLVTMIGWLAIWLVGQVLVGVTEIGIVFGCAIFPFFYLAVRCWSNGG